MADRNDVIDSMAGHLCDLTKDLAELLKKQLDDPREIKRVGQSVRTLSKDVTALVKKELNSPKEIKRIGQDLKAILRDIAELIKAQLDRPDPRPPPR